MTVALAGPATAIIATARAKLETSFRSTGGRIRESSMIGPATPGGGEVREVLTTAEHLGDACIAGVLLGSRGRRACGRSISSTLLRLASESQRSNACAAQSHCG